jgi:hypothetical protein
MNSILNKYKIKFKEVDSDLSLKIFVDCHEVIYFVMRIAINNSYLTALPFLFLVNRAINILIAISNHQIK